MAHHGDGPFDGAERETLRKLTQQLRSSSFLGATGEFPHGKLMRSDEGSIRFAVGSKDGKVILDFGTSVTWVGMTAQQAMDLSSTLAKRAREAARQNGETVHLTIG